MTLTRTHFTFATVLRGLWPPETPALRRAAARLGRRLRCFVTKSPKAHGFSTHATLHHQMDALAELKDATRMFVTRHEEALGSGVPSRMVEAVDGLHEGLAKTLAGEASSAHNRILDLGRTPARTPGHFGAAYDRLTTGSAFEREAWAFTALAKRVAEAEGALLHLRLTLVKGTADGPATSAYAKRVHTETLTVQRTLQAVIVVLDAWTDAARAAHATADGHTPTPATPSARSPRDALRAARECLLGGVPEGAAAPLRRALLAGLAAPLAHPATDELPGVLDAWDDCGAELPIPRADIEAASAALERGTDDPVLAWRLLDFVELVANKAAMTRV